MFVVATAVVLSEVLVVASFLRCPVQNLLFRRPQVWHFLQSLDQRPGLKQLKKNLNYSTCSRRSISLFYLNSSEIQMACRPSFKGQSEIFGFVESSALDAKVLVFGFSCL